MKIAILVARFPPRWLAGTEIATYNIAKHLAKRGYEVHVITSLDKGLPKQSIKQGFCVHRIKVLRVRFLGVIIFSLKAFLLLRKLKVDAVHSQSTTMGIPAVLAKKLLKKPYIVYERGSEVYLPWLFKGPISKLIWKGADAVIALTEDMKIEIEKIYSRHIDVVPNGIDLEVFEGLPRKEAIRQRLRFNNNDKVILFVGTLRPVKGVKYLIQAMNVIAQKEPKTRLMLVGNGEERDYLRGLVKELKLERYVTFVGEVPNEKVPEYMVASDVFVLPSLSEGFPLTILEAMASGLPIVASKVGGLPEIVEDGQNGFLAEPRKPGQIAEKVLLLLKNEGLRQRMIVNNRKKVQQYSSDNTVGRLEAIYRHVL